ncbi:hypothetical protein PINS_up006135 [Pythium insidiosum]|nr:hypothetical protein PINS_up006135 [Pythium insidiosum]
MVATTMMAPRVLIGGSFACDRSVIEPLEQLLQHAVNGGDQVSVEWMPYGVATDVGAWRRDMEARGPTRPQLVVLLVRVCDLEAAHPELLAGPRGAADAAAEEFVAQLREYDARAETRTTMSTKAAPVGLPHVVVLLCPSRPPLESDHDGSTSWRKMECAIETALSTMRHIDCESSSSLLDWFSPSSQGASSWYDALLDKRQHSPFMTAMCRVVAHTTARHIGRLLRSGGGFPVKKVIVLDCDNTLWGGSVADVGPLGVSITPRYLSLQRFVVRQQRERGMLLCLASKNIAQDVEAVFSQRKAEMVLQLDEHIVAKKINWQRKSENLVEMAKELGLGLDSFIFIDDNAVECNEVATALPMVSVIHFNPCESSDSSTFLEREWVFDTALQREVGTVEDAMRTQMYQQNQQRAALQSTSSSQTAFLSSLGIRIHFESLTTDHETMKPQTWDRVLQLHQRTNTFNIATSFSRSVTRDLLVLYTTRPKFTLCAHVTDRFGHYGLVCVALCRIASSSTESTSPSSSSVVVDSLLLSCRALNRGVEHAMVKRIAQVAREHHADDILFSWQPTVRNEPARCFFAAWSGAKFAPDEAPQSIISEREEKLTRSATVSGRWVVKTSDALDLSFLREVERADQAGPSQKPKLQSWLSRSLLWLPRHLYCRLVGISSGWSWTNWWCRVWERACLRLNGLLVTWGLRKLASSHQILQKNSTQIGLLTLRMHSLQDIARFFDEISPHQSQTLDSQHQSEAKRDESATDEAFRMLAREQTKRALLEHISDDNVRVVWSPNRDLDDTTEAAEGSQPTCATPSCDTTVSLDTRQRCAFGRCRTCCYRIQRLLHRACSADTHATAKAKALSSLSDDFDVSVNNFESTWSEGDECCRIHVNPRRRKGK